jgi:hypothetical protein
MGSALKAADNRIAQGMERMYPLKGEPVIALCATMSETLPPA